MTTLFRSYDSMPKIERKALDLAKERILDVGAGAGCHSLVLQERGLDVTAIDISPLSVETMKERGVKKVLMDWQVFRKLKHKCCKDCGRRDYCSDPIK